MQVALTTALAAAAGSLTYATLSAQSQIFGPTLIAPRLPSQVALTFDDGPNPLVTPLLLDLLAQNEIKATFFLIGRYVLAQPALTRRIAAEGHLIGNHTQTHPWLPLHPPTRIHEEISACSKAIEDALGSSIYFFRAPHGARTPTVLRTAHRLGLIPVQWNVICQDWKPIGAPAIAHRATRGIARNQRRGYATNLVLHDGGQESPTAPRLPTVEATQSLIHSLKSGTIFVTLESWTTTEPSHRHPPA